MRDPTQELAINRTIEVTEELETHGPDMLALASEIVAAYVSNNNVPTAELPALIRSVHAALQGLAGGTAIAKAGTPAETSKLPTAAEIRKSIRPEGLVSFLDGKPYQTLKRHLTKHGLEPHAYRKRFGLPADYPMTSAAYSKTRSALAKQIGLGVPGRRSA